MPAIIHPAAVCCTVRALAAEVDLLDALGIAETVGVKA
jgi:hypothetical protein